MDATIPLPVSALPVCPLDDRSLVDRILTFVENFSRASRENSDWYTYQRVFARRIIESIILNDGDTITALFSRQSGKTQSVADVAVGLAVILPILANTWPGDPRLQLFASGFAVGVFAPIQETSQISFERMRSLINSDAAQETLEDPEINVKVIRDSANEIRFDTGSEVRARSASPDSNIEGRTYHLVVIDEAQSVSRYKVEKDIQPMLKYRNGSMVKIGTAGESRGGFHLDIKSNLALYEKGEAPRNHFEFDYLAVFAQKKAMYEQTGNAVHLAYEKSVNKDIKRLGGTDSEEFQMNYCLKWAESRVIAFTERMLLEGREPRRTLNLPCRYGLQVAGLDVAKHKDTTVLTVMQVSETGMVDISGMRTSHDAAGHWMNRITRQDEEMEQNVFYPKMIIGLLELQGRYEQQYNDIVNFLYNFAIKTLVVDATGVGDPIYERMEALLPDVEVLPFKYSTPSKSDLYKYYLQEWGARRVQYCADDVSQALPVFERFEQQHVDLDRVQNGIYITCEAPEDGHDDFPDSAALACYAEKVGRKEVLGEIEVTHLGSVYRPQAGNINVQYAPHAAAQHAGTAEQTLLDMAPQGGQRAQRYQGRRRRR